MSWSYLPFNQTLKKVKNTNKIPRKMFLSSGDYPIISQEKDFINGYWNRSDDLFRVIKPVVIFGDHTKVVKLVGFDFVMGADGVKVFLPGDEFDSAFYYYFLLSVKLPDLGYARHFKLLSELMVPTPPIEEQKRIVAILDSAFEQIDQAKAIAQQNLQNAREIFDSALKQTFNVTDKNVSNKGVTWQASKLGEVLTLEYGKPLDKKLRTDSGKYPAYGANGIKAWTNEYYCKDATIIVGRKGSAGELTLSEERFWPLDVTYFISFDRSKYDLIFLYYLLKDLNLPSLATGVKPGINRNNVYSILVTIPALAEQRQIAEALDILSDNVKELESIYQQKIAALDELKQSLLQQAFSGKLTANHSGTPL